MLCKFEIDLVQIQIPYKQQAAMVVKKLMDSMHRRQSQLSVMAEEKTIRLEHSIKVS